MRSLLRRLTSLENLSAAIMVIVSLFLAALNFFSPLSSNALFTAVLFSLGILGASLVLERLTYLSRLEEKVSSLATTTQLGYMRIYQKRDELPGYGPYTQPARHEILGIGIDLDTTVRRYRWELQTKLQAERDCRVLLMVMNPEANGQMSPMVKHTAQWIGERPEVLQRRIKDNLATLEDFKAKLPDHARERVEIRVYDGIATIALTVDGSHRYGKILVGLLPFGVESNNLWPLIEFQADERGPGISESLYKQYKKMFGKARPWPTR